MRRDILQHVQIRLFDGTKRTDVVTLNGTYAILNDFEQKFQLLKLLRNSNLKFFFSPNR